MKKRIRAADARKRRASANVVDITLIRRAGVGDKTDARIAALTALAIRVFGARDKAMRWLARPHRELGGICPLEMMESAAGARQIEALLRGWGDG